jgi:D-serine deaminase-like pyridoxal phosphate-dependent protein
MNTEVSNPKWFELTQVASIPSPSLLVYPDRIRHNIAEMIRVAGGASRLRPHIKTHKTAEIIALQQEAGITKFKCATIAEAELLGRCNAADVLMAYQPVGPDPERLLLLQEKFPNTRFSALVDHPDILTQIESTAQKHKSKFHLFLDLNTGMNRTGIVPGSQAAALYIRMCNSPYIEASGLHAYDGHIRNTPFEERKAVSDAAFSAVESLKDSLLEKGFSVPEVIAGGSPTFPVHALRSDVTLSPGTTLLWDARYGEQFPDMQFLPAAVLLTRIVSLPAPNTLCLDLGHKAIAPEMEFPRAQLLDFEDCSQVGQSEEHLVLKCSDSKKYEIGQAVYGIPMHICPTVAKYPELLVVASGQVAGTWKVAARDYKLSI